MVIITGSTRSVYDNNSVVNKALTLVSFVFAGYVAIVINRWDRIRNATIGKNSTLHPSHIEATKSSLFLPQQDKCGAPWRT